MFLQIHYLTSYHASLLNRDDAGLAKRIPFGGAQRLRVSSQCQKRHWTEYLRQEFQGVHEFGDRTRHFFGRVIFEELRSARISDEVVSELAKMLATVIFTNKKNLNKLLKDKDPEKVAKKARNSDAYKQFSDDLQMGQPALFGWVEKKYLSGLVADLYKNENGDLDKVFLSLIQKAVNEKENLDVLARQAGYGNLYAGLEGALFGRFVTSDILARVDAPVHVAHAFTTHALDTEVDFFTVVDDLARDEETGAAHANDMELGAGIFYGYVAVDVPLLVSNLTGCDRARWRDQDHGDARLVLDKLIHAIAEVSPGAKLGATAPYARAEHVVLETGTAQPRSLANAYLQPLQPSGHGHPLVQAAGAMARHVDALETMYGDTGEQRYVASIHGWSRDKEPVQSLQEAINNSLANVFGAAS